MFIEDKLLALHRVDHDQDASREHAVETVRGVVTEEDDLAGGVRQRVLLSSARASPSVSAPRIGCTRKSSCGVIGDTLARAARQAV
jgi:hypothetical protein